MAVQICMAAGEGAEIQLRFGAKSAPGTGNPIDGIVKVVRLVRNAEMRFGESFAPFGDAAHILLNGIDIILNSTRAQSFDPSLFSVMGIEPTVEEDTGHQIDQPFLRILRDDRLGNPLLLGRNALSEQPGHDGLPPGAA